MAAYASYYMHEETNAIKYVNEAIKLQPKFASYYDSRGEINYMMNKPKKALCDLNKAIILNPKFRHACIYRALVNFELNKPDAGKKDYEKVVDLLSEKETNDSDLKGYELLKSQIIQLGIQPAKFNYTSQDSSFNAIANLWFKPVLPDPVKNDSRVFTFVEQSAEPIGGLGKFYEWIGHNIQYPASARKFGIQGKVFVKFIIEPSGAISNIEIVKGFNPDCDQEAIRVISTSPNWKPGTQSGVPIRQAYTLPISFKLGR